MKAVSKVHLHLLLSVEMYKLKAENKQTGCVELVDMQGQSLSDKDYLNILRGKDPR